MLPTLAKDFYLPSQHRHGTSVMLSIFCSVLLCFMGLCKGSRLTGWADLDSLPVGACAVVGVTSRPLANQGQGHVASSANQRTPRHPIHRYTGRHHVPHMLATHAVLSHTKSNHNTQRQAGVTVALVQNIMALYKAHALHWTKSRFSLAQSKSLSHALFLFQFLWKWVVQSWKGNEIPF